MSNFDIDILFELMLCLRIALASAAAGILG